MPPPYSIGPSTCNPDGILRPSANANDVEAADVRRQRQFAFCRSIACVNFFPVPPRKAVQPGPVFPASFVYRHL